MRGICSDRHIEQLTQQDLSVINALAPRWLIFAVELSVVVEVAVQFASYSSSESFHCTLQALLSDRDVLF